MANQNYRNIRSGLLDAGFTIRSWAQKHGHNPSTVYAAAQGLRDGVKARRIRKQLQRFEKVAA